MIIAVDFDGTIVENSFPEIGKQIYVDNVSMVSHLIKLQKEGHKVILWTCRCGKSLEEAVSFCLKRGLIFDAVNDDLDEIKEQYKDGMEWWYKNLTARKVYADVYIDDKAVTNIKHFKAIYGGIFK